MYSLPLIVKYFSLKPQEQDSPFSYHHLEVLANAIRLEINTNSSKAKNFSDTKIILKKLIICHVIGEKTNNKNSFSKKHFITIIATLLTIFGNINKIINFI